MKGWMSADSFFIPPFISIYFEWLLPCASPMLGSRHTAIQPTLSVVSLYSLGFYNQVDQTNEWGRNRSKYVHQYNVTMETSGFQTEHIE